MRNYSRRGLDELFLGTRRLCSVFGMTERTRLDLNVVLWKNVNILDFDYILCICPPMIMVK